MDTLSKLSPPQSLLLRGGARVKMLIALLQRGWIEPADGGHLLTNAGYAAINQQRQLRLNQSSLWTCVNSRLEQLGRHQ